MIFTQVTKKKSSAFNNINSYLKNHKRFFLLAVTCLSATGCSLLGAKSALPASLRVEDYNSAVKSAYTVAVDVPTSDFKSALAGASAQRGIRLVPLLYGKDRVNPGYPEYRLFGIFPGSAYSMIGLENADILVAANGFIIDNPGKFPRYIELLSKEKQGFIDVRRAGDALRLKLNFVEAAS
jgi:hypothetical protein